MARLSSGSPPCLSSRSRKTLILPPQGRPTRQAVSSSTPKVSVLGLPSARMLSASEITSPSTQPPETDPSKRPSAAITIWPPTRTGAEPQVPTTVASATRPSLSSQVRAAPRTSWVSALRIGCAGVVIVRARTVVRGGRGGSMRQATLCDAQHKRHRRRAPVPRSWLQITRSRAAHDCSDPLERPVEQVQDGLARGHGRSVVHRIDVLERLVGVSRPVNDMATLPASRLAFSTSPVRS